MCQGNPHAAVLVLQPVVHSNVSLKAILEKRKKVEERLVQSIGVQVRGHMLDGGNANQSFLVIGPKKSKFFVPKFPKI